MRCALFRGRGGAAGCWALGAGRGAGAAAVVAGGVGRLGSSVGDAPPAHTTGTALHMVLQAIRAWTRNSDPRLYMYCGAGAAEKNCAWARDDAYVVLAHRKALQVECQHELGP